MKKKYNIKGMHCRSCEMLLEKNISRIEDVKNVEVSYKKGVAEVEFVHGAANDTAIAKAVQEAGYSLGQGGKLPWLSGDSDTWFDIMLGVSALMVLFMAGKLLGVFNGIGTAFGAAPTYPIVFVIGLTAGISTCMAMVGGLVAGFSYGVGVEKVFPVHSPYIEKVEIERVAKVRRAKLYYLRERAGKKARLREG